MVVEGHKDGKIVYETKCDNSLIELPTKRLNQKKKYLALATQIFNNLNLLSSTPKHKSSGESKLSGSVIYYTTPKELLDRLKRLTGTRLAGNNILQHWNEI